MNREIDISGILHSIKVPTLVIHLTGDTLVSVEGGRELAASIPARTIGEIPGIDHLPWLDAGDRILAEMEEFLTGSRSSGSRRPSARYGCIHRYRGFNQAS